MDYGEDNAPHESKTRLARRSGHGVVKRQSPRSAQGINTPETAPGAPRGASARSRVCRVAEVGSDASSVAGECESQGKQEQRDLARRKPRSADAIDGGEKANRCVSLEA